jgi:hypothetical protein
MPNNSRECQGRGEHGHFGSGTCGGTSEDSSLDSRIEPLAYAAIGAGALRRNYESWLAHGGLKHLQDIVPQWVADADLDPNSFRTRHFGSFGRVSVAASAQKVAVHLADAQADAGGVSDRRAATGALAEMVRAVRPEAMTRMLAHRPVPDGKQHASDLKDPLNTEQNVQDLAKVMESEAGGQPGSPALKAVGFTVLNRMKRNNTTRVRDVGGGFSHNAPKVQPKTVEIARQVLNGMLKDPTDGATHFYTPNIMPREGAKEPLHRDTAGGLESVDGVTDKYGRPVRNYRPVWSAIWPQKAVAGVKEKDFKFYQAPGNGHVR